MIYDSKYWFHRPLLGFFLTLILEVDELFSYKETSRKGVIYLIFPILVVFTTFCGNISKVSYTRIERQIRYN